LVTPDLRRASGGFAENVPRLAAALVAEGLAVQLFFAGDNEMPPLPGVEYLACRPAWPRALGRSPEMRRRLLETDVQLIHAHGVWMRPLRYAAMAASRLPVPLVLSPRGMLAPWALRRSPSKKWAAAQFVHRHAFEQVAGWHATSEPEAADIRQLGFAQPICVAPNGIDPPSPDAALVRSAYEPMVPGLAGKRVLLFYSRFHPKKRVVELIRDFAAVREAHPGWHLLVVGLPEAYRLAELRAEAQRAGVAEHVTILDGGPLPKPYPLAEAFVLPSFDENFGQVVAEALAHGVPVLTTTGTPWRGLDTVGAGWCVSLQDFREELARLLGRSNEELREAGRRGREWVLSKFDWRISARRLVAFYQRLLRDAAPA
jgi:glycosyltransferase involved in cell wall biosynthesis